MPTFSFLAAPVILTNDLRRNQNAPLPLFRVLIFGTMLDARLFSVLNHSTSELLRTL
jgi:hypothetical protein